MRILSVGIVRASDDSCNNAIFGMLGLELSTPDHTTLSRRGQHLDLTLRRVPAGAGLHLIVDSTGLSIVGEGEWAAAKHGGRGRRGWKTLHLGVDRSGVIVARALSESRRARRRSSASAMGGEMGRIRPTNVFENAHPRLAARRAAKTVRDERQTDCGDDRAGAADSGARDAQHTFDDRHARRGGTAPTHRARVRPRNPCRGWWPHPQIRGRAEWRRPVGSAVANAQSQCSVPATFHPVSSGLTTGLPRIWAHSAS